MIQAKTYEYKTNNKIIQIYENDLKYKNNRNINVNNITNFDEKNDYDILDYRIKECIADNYNSLDLSHMNLKTIPLLSEKIVKNIKYLFISDNEIEIMEDLDNFTKLIVLDICSNKLKKIPKLPKQIEELSIRNNKLIDVNNLSSYEYLQRLDCSDNYICSIPIINSLENLVCTNNKLETISLFPNLKKLSCGSNNIKKIDSLNKLKILDCHKNQIEIISGFENLKELYCNDNKIKIINNLNKLEIIHCYNNFINKFEYFVNLKELICDYNNIKLSTNYKILESNIYKDNIALIYFV